MPFLYGEDPPEVRAAAAALGSSSESPSSPTTSEPQDFRSQPPAPTATSGSRRGPINRGGRHAFVPNFSRPYTSRFSEHLEEQRAVIDSFDDLPFAEPSAEASQSSNHDANTSELLRSYQGRFIDRQTPEGFYNSRASVQYAYGLSSNDQPSNSDHISSSIASNESNMTSSTASTATPPPHPFEKRVQATEISKDDMNALVMDFLVSKGYPGTAERFAKEANVPMNTDADTINERVEVRDLIYKEEIITAIEKINDIDPQLLDQDSKLHFALLRLQLVKLARVCQAKMPNDDDEFLVAQAFAEEHLGPRAPASPETLDDLENTMMLLMYTEEKLPARLKHLLLPELREEVAERVNEALLERMGESTHSKLADIVRLRVWAEDKARESKVDLPEHLDIGLDQHPSAQNGHNGAPDTSHANGDAEPMVS